MILAQSRLRRSNGSKIVVLFLITLLSSGCGLFNKTRDNSNKDKVVKDRTDQTIDTLDISKVPETEIPPIRKDAEVEEPDVDYSSYKKETYKIGLFLPFNAQDATFDANDLSDEKFVNYYAGVRLALEEFDDEGYKFIVNVVDSERSEETVAEKLQSSAFEGTDVIVGPYDRDALSLAAEYGKNNMIAVVSPWLSSTRITDDNPFYIQLRASLSSHYFKLIEHAHQNFKSDEIVLIGRNNDAAKNRFKYFQKTYAALNNFSSSDPLQECFYDEGPLGEGMRAFGDLFENGGKKAIILPNWNYDDESFIYSVLRTLNIEKRNTDVYVYGMPILFDSDKIEFDFYQNLNMRICLSEFVDWEDMRVKSFMRKFYDNYGALPTSDAFEGYDMMTFIGRNLIKYGINFQLNLELDRDRYLQTAYDIQKVFDEGDEKFENVKYLENKHLDLVQYIGDKFVKID
ncbi:ABC transporter substrate-binding protein [Portibacter marinus]|uniref:ABC transporter substrate-binding protein n=1 Tax=Portibacter marinus TaxID=2898660 RepID=UPI001F380722|nr:ABC transporter substrate-binding protein [Portibacter marinus]